MIIGISGKIGSGKDTVGKIIQYLTYKPWTTLEGEKGKDAPYDLKDWLDDGRGISISHSSNTWQVKKFAYKLKQICSLLTGIPVEDFEKQEVKDLTLQEAYEKGLISKGFIDSLED